MPAYRLGLIERSTGRGVAVTILAETEAAARRAAMRDGWLIGEVRRLPDRGEAGDVQPTSVKWRRLRAWVRVVLVPLFVALVALFIGFFFSPL